MAKPRTPLSQVSYGLYLVGTRGREGDHVMIANWLTQVSFEPEIVALAVEKGSVSRQLIDESKAFSVSILKAAQKDVAARFAKADRPKSESREFVTKVTGAPIFAEGSAYLDCRVLDSKEAGDHLVYFGEVVDSAMLDPESDALTLRDTGWRYGG
jgi:flavin reductase (DIM6/NTAB) family NADH-FMN oxidoreductase RutF